MSSFTSSSSPAAPQAARRRLGAPLRTILFFAIVAVTLGATGELLESISVTLDGNTRKAQEMMSLRGEKNDVVYLGDSTTFEGVNPAVVDELLGTRSYNLGSGGQTFLASEIVLRHYLARNARPRVIMLGVFVNRPRTDSQIDYAVSQALTSDLHQLYRDRWLKYEGRSPSRSDGILNRLKAYRYRSAIGYGIKYLVGGEARLPRLIQGHLAFDFSRGAELGPDREVEESPAGLDDLLAFCAEQHLPVLMFEPPNTPGYSAGTRGRAAFLRRLQSCARDEPVVAFRSFNDEASLSYPPNEWVGLNHLNSKGAIRFTREQIVPYLGEYLGSLSPRTQP